MQLLQRVTDLVFCKIVAIKTRENDFLAAPKIHFSNFFDSDRFQLRKNSQELIRNEFVRDILIVCLNSYNKFSSGRNSI